MNTRFRFQTLDLLAAMTAVCIVCAVGVFLPLIWHFIFSFVLVAIARSTLCRTNASATWLRVILPVVGWFAFSASLWFLPRGVPFVDQETQRVAGVLLGPIVGIWNARSLDAFLTAARPVSAATDPAESSYPSHETRENELPSHG